MISHDNSIYILLSISLSVMASSENPPKDKTINEVSPLKVAKDSEETTRHPGPW
jgi:hypothetical protein